MSDERAEGHGCTGYGCPACAEEDANDLASLRARVETLAGELDRRSDSASYDAAACDDYARGLEVAYNNAADLVRALLPGGGDAKETT